MPATFLYTLELAGGFWYVGTTQAPSRRLKEHRDGHGAEWTRLHKPLGFSKRYAIKRLTHAAHDDCDTRLQEDAQVKKVMLDQGINLVRGGSYSQKLLRRDDTRALCKELFHANNGCLRCGRLNHWAKDCFAATDVCGNAIERSRGFAGRRPGAQKRKKRGWQRRSFAGGGGGGGRNVKKKVYMRGSSSEGEGESEDNESDDEGESDDDAESDE